MYQKLIQINKKVSYFPVWTGYSTKISFQNHFLQFNWIFNDKNLFKKFNISHTLSFKISKSLSLNLYSLRVFQQYQQHTQNSPIIFSFDLNDFLVKELFNIQ
jgi:hypothetical protein